VSTALLIFSQLLTLLGLLGLGWLLTRTGKLTDDKPLGSVVSNLGAPAMVIHFLQMPQAATMLREIGITAVGYAAALAAGAAVALALGVVCRRPRAVIGTWAAIIVFPNSIFMGMPIMQAIYGDDILPLLAGIMLVFNLGSFIFGAWLLSLEGTQKTRPKTFKLLLQPAVWCSLIGALLVATGIVLPAPVAAGAQMLAYITTPVAMVAIGSQLAKCSLRETFFDGKVYLVVLTRLIPAGLAGHLLLRLFISDPVILGVLTISVCMPAAVLTPVIAAQQGGDSLFCSKVTFVSTLMCIITAPVLIPLLV